VKRVVDSLEDFVESWQEDHASISDVSGATGELVDLEYYRKVVGDLKEIIPNPKP